MYETVEYIWHNTNDNNRVFDPSYVEQHEQDIDSLAIDDITWFLIITDGLTKFYGLVGLATFLEIEKIIDSRTCLIRIIKEDEPTVINSLTTHRFKLNTYYGGSIDVDTYINHISTEVLLSPRENL